MKLTEVNKIVCTYSDITVVVVLGFLHLTNSQGHTETRSQFQVLPERLEKPGIELTTHNSQGKMPYLCTMEVSTVNIVATFDCQLTNTALSHISLPC